MLTIIAFLLFIAALLYSVQRHYKLWRSAQQKPNAGEATPIKHKKEFMLRVLLLLPPLFLFVLARGFTLSIMFSALLMMAFLFWSLFDGLFNLKRGKDWWFIGTVDKDESFFDNIKRMLGPLWSKVIQIASAIGTLILYFSQ